MSAADTLPNCIARNPVGRRWIARVGWCVPVYCANCGVLGGYVPESAVSKEFAFYLCENGPLNCEKLGAIAGVTMVPDEVFWQKAKEAQIEKFGRVLTPEETAEALKDEHHILTKLTRERFDWKKGKL